MTGAGRSASVFAVEDTSAQLVWGDLGAGQIEVRLAEGDREIRAETIESPGGPGSICFEGLSPGVAHRALLRAAGGAAGRLQFRTLQPPPGAELFRFATLSDLHIGRAHFGFVKRIREDRPEVAHPLRCGRAALDELLAWGAQHLIIKGDLVDSGRPQEWDDARKLLADVPIPIDLIAGNHENSHPGCEDPWSEAERVGLNLHRGVSSIDVEGLRLVLMDSTTRGVDVGRWHHLADDAADAVGRTSGAAMLVVHHHPQPLPVPTHLPRGIPSHRARPFIAGLRRANPAVIGTSGHTHRNRRRDICGVPWTEVGSPKDFPGGWAGYVVYEGGIRQVVRRVAGVDCLDWLELTRGAAMGAWGHWSPGTLDDRCFSYEWPTR